MSVYRVTFASSQYFRSFVSRSTGNLVLSVLMLSASHWACLSRFMAAVPAGVAASVAASNACFDHRRSISFPPFLEQMFHSYCRFYQVSCDFARFSPKSGKTLFLAVGGGHTRLRLVFPLPFGSCCQLPPPACLPSFRSGFQKRDFPFSFFRLLRSVSSGCLVGAPEHGRALVTGPPFTLAARSRDHRKVHRARCAPLAPTEPGPVSRVAPCGAAILQHDLYSPSALGLYVPPGCWLHSGSRGDSLHGLVHTSPLRHRVRPGGATVATTPGICTPRRRRKAARPAA